MKFILHRDPENRSQTLPYPALQLSQLADADELPIQADAGSILVSRDNLTVRQALTTIGHLYEVIDSLMAVSYTHLDVYKRQRCGRPVPPPFLCVVCND